jgi:hypothetical protein
VIQSQTPSPQIAKAQAATPQEITPQPVPQAVPQA